MTKAYFRFLHLMIGYSTTCKMKYKTVKSLSRVEQTIKKSKFIGTAKPVSNIKEAENFIREISNEFRKVTHNVFAYRVGFKKDERFLYSDGREPSGSAGLPTFNAIRSAEVTNCAVVVTRFFGGIKLGIGGLIRAYYSTARAAIEQAGIIEVNIRKSIKLCFPYSEIRLAIYLIHQFNGEVVNKNYGKSVQLTVSVEEDLIEQFIRAVRSKTQKITFC